MRQPQVRNASPDSALNTSTAMIGQEQAGGHAELRPGRDETSMVAGARPFHRQQHRAAPLAADADALDEAQRGQQDRAPDADAVIGRHQADQERGDAHQHQRGDQRRLAAEPVAPMAEDRRADRARGETDGVDRERLQRADQRIGMREVQLGETRPVTVL